MGAGWPSAGRARFERSIIRDIRVIRGFLRGERLIRKQGRKGSQVGGNCPHPLPLSRSGRGEKGSAAEKVKFKSFTNNWRQLT